MGNENTGSRIKEVRAHLDLSPKAFANLIGVTQTTISGIESGGANPSRQLLKNVCMRFGVSEDWLVEGKGSMLCTSGSGQTATADGDLISRGALMEAMAGISLDTEEDVRAWIEAELLVEAAPSIPDGNGDFTRCDVCDYCERTVGGTFLCSLPRGLGGILYPWEGDGCSRGRSGKEKENDNAERQRHGGILQGMGGDQVMLFPAEAGKGKNRGRQGQGREGNPLHKAQGMPW